MGNKTYEAGVFEQVGQVGHGGGGPIVAGFEFVRWSRHSTRALAESAARRYSRDLAGMRDTGYPLAKAGGVHYLETGVVTSSTI